MLEIHSSIKDATPKREQKGFQGAALTCPLGGQLHLNQNAKDTI